MDKKKKQLIITGVLLVIMVVMMAQALFPAKKGGTRQAKAAASAAGVSTETMTANMSFLAVVRQNESARLLQETQWDKPWGRDPFALSQLTGGSAESVGNFVLSGIVWDERMPVAIINQKLTKSGDGIDGCRVVEIRRSSVTIVCDDKPFELQLFRSRDSSALPGDQQAQS